MKKIIKTQYDTVKVSFGIYIIAEVRKRTNKEYPTETDIKKMLLKTGNQSAGVLSAAKQISRYCKTNHNYLLKAKEETFNLVAQALNLPVQHFNQFHERISQLYKRSSNYYTYLEKAENYLLQFKAADDEIYFKRLLNYQEETGIKTILINYPFGELDANLPATHFGAYTDIKTEVLFKQLCTRMNVSNYKILTDSSVVEQFEKENKKRETWVNIGLFGNRLTASLLKKNVFGTCFNWLPQQNKIVLMGKEYAANREKKTDYGVFARLQLSNRKTIILIGGIEGYGTEKTGEYVWRNWRKMYDIVTAGEASSVIVLFKIFNGKIQQQKVVELPEAVLSAKK
ncbi:hypothetical protein QWZ08_11975 [Ferruginibacter paludis]|uniref:hypothetical protein n=1 Tax=Ferruginibacter paludis TaxID=1310417 RepID=UPI0025B48F1F|nr:hypothetical protein [Ferruginibacter paludis]MDN3656352.1 hypothetical protein [Ferruginibacter paludis]